MAGALLGALVVWPAVTGAQTPAQDSVRLVGVPSTTGLSTFTFTVRELNAASGPSGEAPSGAVSFDVFSGGFFQLTQRGPVTCLDVNGNTAVIGFDDQVSHIETTIQVVDDQPDRFDVIAFERAPTDCSPGTPLPGHGGPLSGGDVIVHDAPRLPTSKDQCKNGGWRAFGVFKNQGDCVSYVATHGKNQPAGR